MGSFKLGKMTLGGLFKKPETLLYPVQTKRLLRASRATW